MNLTERSTKKISGKFFITHITILNLSYYISRYYNNLIAKNDYNVDSAKLKEYFPLDTVVSGMLEIYQTLLGLKFTEIGIFTDQSFNNHPLLTENPEKWHDEVSLHKVQDARSGETLGYFYMDLFPREGKLSANHIVTNNIIIIIIIITRIKAA